MYRFNILYFVNFLHIERMNFSFYNTNVAVAAFAFDLRFFTTVVGTFAAAQHTPHFTYSECVGKTKPFFSAHASLCAFSNSAPDEHVSQYPNPHSTHRNVVFSVAPQISPHTAHLCEGHNHGSAGFGIVRTRAHPALPACGHFEHCNQIDATSGVSHAGGIALHPLSLLDLQPKQNASWFSVGNGVDGSLFGRLEFVLTPSPFSTFTLAEDKN